MSDQNQLVEIKVYRFDPTVDKEPRYQAYKVPQEGYSILNALQYAYDNYDKSLSFRAGCQGKGAARCGACPVVVNGIPVLSCYKMVEPGMVIEPHPKFEHVKDLVYNRSKAAIEVYDAPQHFVQEIDDEKCVGCNDCVVMCPMAVYELRKVNKKLKARSKDASSCCGVTCEICVDGCSKGAIAIKPLA